MSPKKKRRSKLKIFAMCCGCFLMLLVVMYIFRESLFSQMICRQIAAVIKENTGIEVHIENFSGTYFTNVRVEKATLVDGGGVVSEFQFDEAFVSYNLLGALTGEQIVQHVTLKNLRTTVIGFPPTKQTASPKEKAIELDIDFILKQIPDVDVTNLYFAYDIGEQYLQVANLDFVNKHHSSELQIESLYAKNADTGQKISVIKVNTEIKNKIFAIKNVQAHIDQYDQDLTIPDVFSLDLGNLQQLPISFSLPTPGGVIDGTIAIASGKNIKIGNGEVDFNKTIDLVSLLRGKKFKNAAMGKLGFRAEMDLPDWNVNEMQGITQIDIFNSKPRVWKKEVVKQEGLKTLFYIEDFAILEKVARTFIEDLQELESKGKVALANVLKVENENIAISGRIHEGDVQTKFFPEQDIKGKWKGSFDTKKLVCDISAAELQIGDIKSTLKTHLDFSENKESFVEAQLNILSLGQYINLVLPEDQKDAYNADISIKISGRGILPSGRELTDTFRGKIECGFNNLVVANNKLGNFTLVVDFTVEHNKVDVLSFVGKWNDKKVLHVSGNSGWEPMSDFHLSGRYRMKNVAQQLQKFIPDLHEQFTTHVDGRFDLRGKIPYGTNFDIALKHQLQLHEVSLLNKLEYNLISIPLHANITPKLIKLSQLKVAVNNEDWLKVRGHIPLEKEKNSVVYCDVNLPQPLQHVAKFSSIPVETRLEKIQVRNKIWGKVLAFAEGEPVYLKSQVALNNGKIDKLSFAKLQVDVLSKATLQQLFVRSLAINMDDKLRLALRSMRAHFSGNTLVDVQGKVFASGKTIRQVVPQLQIADINSKFSLYANWKSVEAVDSQQGMEQLATLLRKPPREIWRHAQQNLHADVSFALQSKKIQIDNFLHRDADILLRSQLKKGKYRAMATVGLDRQKIVSASLSGDKDNITIRNKVRIANVKKYLTQFAPQYANINTDITASMSLKTPMPKDLKTIPPLNMHCEVSLQKGNIRDQFTFNEIKFISKIKTLRRKVHINTFLHLDENKLLNTHGDIVLAKPYRCQLNTNINIRGIEKYLALAGQEKVLSGDFSLNNTLNATVQEDVLQSDVFSSTRIELQNGHIAEKPYRSVLLAQDVRLQDAKVDLQKMSVAFDGKNLGNAFAKWDIHKQKLMTSEISSSVNLQELASKFVPNEDIAGNSNLKITAHGDLERVNCRVNYSLVNGRYQSRKLQPVVLHSVFQVEKEKFTLDTMNLKYASKPIFNLTGSAGYKPGSDFRVLLTSDIGEAINDFAPLIGQEPPIFNGESKIEIESRGKIPEANGALDLGIEIKIPFTNKPQNTFWQMNLGEISLWGNKKQAPHGFGCLLKIGGTTQKPLVKSLFNYKQELVRIPQANTRINDIMVDGMVEEQKLSLGLKCLVGGGSIESNTTILFNKQYFPTKVDFQVKGKRILLIRNEMLYGRADLDVFIQGDVVKNRDGQPKFVGKLGGVVDITEFKVTADVTVDAVLQSSPERTVGGNQLGIDSPFLDMELNLRVKVSQVAVYSSLARIRMRGDIYVKGSAAAPKISGAIRTTSGKLFLPQGNMDIRQCIVSFSSNRPLIPQINIISESQIRDYVVTVTITGTPGDMAIEYASSPALPKEDVLTLLLTGATRSELQRSGGGKQLGDLGSSVLLQQILNTLGIGGFVSAQVTIDTTIVTVAPESWGGVGIQGKMEQTDTANTSALNILYRIQLK